MTHNPAPHLSVLTVLARQQFGDLSEAEEQLLRAASNGLCTTCTAVRLDLDDTSNPAHSDVWGKERIVRADLIRWLCVVPEVSRNVAPRGIQIRHAIVNDALDLFAVTVPFPISFLQCRLGVVDLRYAVISGLFMSGSSIDSLNADGAETKNMVFLNEGFSAGMVRLVGARIGASLDFTRGTLTKLDVALHADRLEVRGDVLFNGFSADGDVEMMGAQIGTNLNCDGARFGNVNFERTAVKGGFFWRGVKRCTSLDLSRVSSGSLSDDETSWGKTEKLNLDGFVYEQIIGKGTKTGAAARLNWLARQEVFAPQPYRQLAKLLREMGDDAGAKTVMFELESRARAEQRQELSLLSPARYVRESEDLLSRTFVGYGIYPFTAVWWLGGLTTLSWIVHRKAERLRAMAPTDKQAYEEFHKGRLPVHYQPFSPLIYAVENSLPLVKFGQDERWQPDPNPKQSSKLTPARLRMFRWIMIALGWLLATFFVAGLSGIVKAY